MSETGRDVLRPEAEGVMNWSRRRQQDRPRGVNRTQDVPRPQSTTIFGMITIGSGVGRAWGLGGGFLHDLTGSYEPVMAFAVFGIACAVVPFFTITVLRGPRPENALRSARLHLFGLLTFCMGHAASMGVAREKLPSP